jgi:tRNA pseudouridine13 synthase
LSRTRKTSWAPSFGFGLTCVAFTCQPIKATCGTACWHAGWKRTSSPRPAQLIEIPLRHGPLPMHRSLTEGQQAQFAALELPLHTARIHLEDDDPRKPFFDAALADEGLTQEQLKVKGSRDLFFSKGERRALCLPSELSTEADDDDSQPGRKKLILRFDLPRGCYATLIVKRVTRLHHDA